MLTSPIRLLTFVLVALALSAPSVPAAEKLLHLAIGDPARKDRVAPVVLDGITDTRTGELITPAELAARLSTTRLLLIGEEHTSQEFHRVQLQVLEALVKAGRHVMIGLEMYPYTEQGFLDEWRNGRLTEEEFLRNSRWYENWGYNWLYYRDIFLLARDNKLPMHGVNVPREVVSAVRMKGLANLPPELAAHVPTDIDVDNADHIAFFKATFEGNEGPVHGMSMPEEMFTNMRAAQCTWDASMGYYGVQALKKSGDPKAIMVILVGSGHVAYGVGIERQAKKWADGPITTVIPVSVGSAARGFERDTQASYASFTWGIADEVDTAYPTMGTSTAVGAGEAARRVIIVQEGSAAARAGVKVGDILQAFDGVRLEDKETFNRVMATKRWGDAAPLVVKRGTDTVTLTVVFRRTLREK
jgi:uncharacterized iron-regulated protein